MGENKDPLKPPPVLLTSALLSSLRGRGVVACHCNPLSTALKSITNVARGHAYLLKPKALAKVGRDLSDLVPYGYWECFEPPLSVEQLTLIMADPNTIPYLQKAAPGTIGPNILKDLESIVRYYN